MKLTLGVINGVSFSYLRGLSQLYIFLFEFLGREIIISYTIYMWIIALIFVIFFNVSAGVPFGLHQYHVDPDDLQGTLELNNIFNLRG